MLKYFARTFVLLLLIGAAACGGDDSGDGDVGARSEEDAEQAAEDALEDELGGECGFLGRFAGTGLESAFDPTTAMTEGGEAFELLAEEVQEVAEAAPDEISDAFRTMADGFEQFAEVFSDIDLSDPQNIDPSVFEQLEQGPGEDFEAAAQEIDAWIQENCPGLTGG